LKLTYLALLLFLGGSIGLALLHPFGNPRVEPHKGLNTLLKGSNLPAQAKRVLITKCADCHSNETRWPVYARLAPGSWLIERDITQARAKMNLSHWEQISPEEQDVLTAKIIHEAKEGEMPPLQYRVLHWGARVSPGDLVALRSMSGNGGDEAGTGSGAGDAARGKAVFQKRCTGCHAMDGDREGPRLAGIFGRKAGTVPSFEYSTGLKNSGITWNDATLEKWLTDPDLMVPDTNMDFHVPKAQERADLIAYFKHP
jgi:cytochrome c